MRKNFDLLRNSRPAVPMYADERELLVFRTFSQSVSVPKSVFRHAESEVHLHLAFFYLLVQCRVHIVHVLLIQTLTQTLDRLTETLEMHDLTRPQELDDIVDIRIVREPQDVVIGASGLLLCCNHIRTTCD